MTKANFLHVAEVVDAWRVVPRLFLGAVTTFVCWALASLLLWYEHTPEAWTACVTAALTVLTGALATLQGYVFRVYTDNGRDWKAHPVEDSTK